MWRLSTLLADDQVAALRSQALKGIAATRALRANPANVVHSGQIACFPHMDDFLIAISMRWRTETGRVDRFDHGE